MHCGSILRTYKMKFLDFLSEDLYKIECTVTGMMKVEWFLPLRTSLKAYNFFEVPFGREWPFHLVLPLHFVVAKPGIAKFDSQIYQTLFALS